jgi:hypothetical protein
MGLTDPQPVALTLPWGKGPRVLGVLAGASLLLCLIPTGALAQQQGDAPEISSHSLPDAPLPNLGLGPQNSAQQTQPAEGSASVVGTVLDVRGASVPGAQVSLMHKDGTELHTIVSEANGEFTFTKILPGSYLVIVNAEGFATFTSVEFIVTMQQSYEVPGVSLSIVKNNRRCDVRGRFRRVADAPCRCRQPQ